MARAAAIAFVALSGLPSSARAEAPSEGERAAPSIPPPTAPGRGGAPKNDRPVAMFVGGLDMLALPAAEVCSSPGSPCRPGETSLAISPASMIRWRRIAVGAGADVAFGLRPEQGVRAAGRDHVRSYFSFDGLFRYYLPITRRLEWWLGGSVGVAVLRDTWSVPSDREPYSDIRTVGPQRLILRSEGLSLGPGIGADWRFRDRWLVGTQFRYLNWFMPSQRATTPFQDSASLAGRIDVFEFGFFLGFRSPL